MCMCGKDMRAEVGRWQSVVVVVVESVKHLSMLCGERKTGMGPKVGDKSVKKSDLFGWPDIGLLQLTSDFTMSVIRKFTEILDLLSLFTTIVLHTCLLEQVWVFAPHFIKDFYYLYCNSLYPLFCTSTSLIHSNVVFLSSAVNYLFSQVDVCINEWSKSNS